MMNLCERIYNPKGLTQHEVDCFYNNTPEGYTVETTSTLNKDLLKYIPIECIYVLKDEAYIEDEV